VAAIVGSLDASQLAEEGKQLTAFRLFLLTRRRGKQLQQQQQQQQTEAGFPLFFYFFLFSGHEPIYFTENKEKTLRVSYDRDTHTIEYMN
jgi:hypothetical protein